MSFPDSSDTDSDGPSSPKRYNLEFYQEDDQKKLIKKAGKNPSRQTEWRRKTREAAKSAERAPELKQSDDIDLPPALNQQNKEASRTSEQTQNSLPPSPHQASTSREIDVGETDQEISADSPSRRESVPREISENDIGDNALGCSMEIDRATIHEVDSNGDSPQDSPVNSEDIPSGDTSDSQSYQSSLRSGDGSDTDALSDITDDTDFRQFEDEIIGDDIYHKIMFERSAITVGDVILMVKACSLRFSISREGQLAIGRLMKICAGPEFEDLNLSEYFMTKYVPSNNDQLDHHYYCTSCCKTVVYSTNAQKKIPTTTITCPNESCLSPNLVSVKSQNYFTSVSMEYQLKRIFSNEILLNDIIRNIESRKHPSEINGSSFKDVHDGSLNKQMMTKHGDDTTIVLSGALNADGAPFNKNNKMHGWPSQMLLNDLSPKLRWKYVILTGMLMTVTKEPGIEVLNLYMEKTLLDQLKRLNRKRITVTVRGRTYTFCFKILNISLDTPARAMFQNRMLYSAYYGCSWCYQLGHRASGSIRFPSSQLSVLRSHESHLQDVRDLEELHRANPRLRTLRKKKHVRGAKGPCFMMSTEYETECEHLDAVWSFAYEYMHGISLGISQYIIQDLKDKECPVQLKPRQWAQVESRLLKIKPTQDIHRLPREGQLTGQAKMKASESRAWTLFFSLPCLKDILDEEALSHLSLLTKISFSHLKDEMTSEEVDEGEEDSDKFIKGYETIYKKEPNFNIHALKHAAESIRRTGPPAVNSAFPFESNIYYLKQLVNGPKDMNKQISKKYMQLMYFRTGCTQHPNISQNAKEFCEGLFVRKLSKNAVTDDDCGVAFFQNKGDEDVQSIGPCTIYSKCVYRDVVFHSIRYTSVEKTDDTFVQLSSKEYARIIDILSHAGSCSLRLCHVEIEEQLPFENVTHIRKVIGWDESRTYVRDIQLVERKILFVNVGVAQYVCTLPNRIEVQ